MFTFCLEHTERRIQNFVDELFLKFDLDENEFLQRQELCQDGGLELIQEINPQFNISKFKDVDIDGDSKISMIFASVK